MSTETQPLLEAAQIKETTRVGYMKSVMAAVRHSKAKRTIDWEDPANVSITQVVQDLEEREDLTRETKLVARSALLWYIKSGQVQASEDTRRGMSMLESMTAPRGRKPTLIRPKTISEEDLAKLMDEIYDRTDKSAWARRCAVWICAGLVTGARPIEWLHAGWSDEEKTTLRLKNAKVKLLAPAFIRKDAKEDHPDLESLHYWDLDESEHFREIPLDKEADRSMVENHLYCISEFAPHGMSEKGRHLEFQKYHNECALVIRRACRKIWGNKKSFSLYTMRGQFSANMQAAHGPEKTAELMGHSSADSPSAAYYGRQKYAHSRFKSSKAPHREGQLQAPVEQASAQNAGPVD